MTLEGELTLLDPFTHTKQDREKIENFDFLTESSITESEKVMIIETFCTLVTVTGKYLEKQTFKKVLKKVDAIRKMIRIQKIQKIYNNYNYQHIFFINDQGKNSDWFFIVIT